MDGMTVKKPVVRVVGIVRFGIKFLNQSETYFDYVVIKANIYHLIERWIAKQKGCSATFSI